MAHRTILSCIRYTALAQHSNQHIPSVTDPDPLDGTASGDVLTSPPSQINNSVTDSSTQHREEADASTAPSLADAVNLVPFDMDDAFFETYQLLPSYSVDSEIVATELDFASPVDTTPPQENVSYTISTPSIDTPIFTLDHRNTISSVPNSQYQTASPLPSSMSQSPPDAPSRFSSSGANSVLVLENLDDETRDAVMRLIWSKTKCTTLRLE